MEIWQGILLTLVIVIAALLIYEWLIKKHLGGV
ncbi:MAG: hypothetical protein DDT40_01841 [candidate division WS2 bacterium]|nr:hypothetical protein [Candidatus Psychracetigena formicireducens]